MRGRAFAIALALLAGAGAGCKGKAKGKARDGTTVTVAPIQDGGPGHPPALRPPKVPPPIPVASPPADAETITGVEGAPAAVIYIKRLTAGTGDRPGRNDTVAIKMNGWRTNGDTFLTTTVRKRPVMQSLAVMAPGFSAAVSTMRQGERAMMWIPPELGYMGPPTGTPETTVYEVELISFERGPDTPPDVAMAPAGATKTPSGHPYVVIKPGTGKVNPRGYDVVTFAYSAWSSTGRLFDSSEITKQPRKTFPFHEPVLVEEMLRTMVVGQRVRMWFPADVLPAGPSTPAGQICYELELLEVLPKQAPPPVPPSVAAPPAGAKKTPKGVSYLVLKPGKGGTHPTSTDVVKLTFTGWLASGRMYDSSEIHGQPSAVPMSKLMEGWADAMLEMSPGERRRLWIPAALAYKNQPGLPPGTLVIETELLEILKRPGTGQSVLVPVDAGPGAAP